jgi:hypothetical protein
MKRTQVVGKPLIIIALQKTSDQIDEIGNIVESRCSEGIDRHGGRPARAARARILLVGVGFRRGACAHFAGLIGEKKAWQSSPCAKAPINSLTSATPSTAKGHGKGAMRSRFGH